MDLCSAMTQHATLILFISEWNMLMIVLKCVYYGQKYPILFKGIGKLKNTEVA